MSLVTKPHFRFTFPTGKPETVKFFKGLGRMAILIRTRRELEGPNFTKEYNILTDIIEKFQDAFTLEWNDYISTNLSDKQKLKVAIDPKERDEILFTHLHEIAKVRKEIRSLGGNGPGRELERMMGLITEALKGFSADDARMKQWLTMHSKVDDLAEQMLGYGLDKDD
ncbi:MAG: hypothetical protein Q9221_006221 [Calogaya cf. arnoldii]